MAGEPEFALALMERSSEEAWRHNGEGEWQARSSDAKDAVIRYAAAELHSPTGLLPASVGCTAGAHADPRSGGSGG
jgi:hypothetical protein